MTYYLQARRLNGCLSDPSRNDTETIKSESLVELRAEAGSLRSRGFTVWIFADGPSNLPGADGRKLVEELKPTVLRCV